MNHLHNFEYKNVNAVADQSHASSSAILKMLESIQSDLSELKKSQKSEDLLKKELWTIHDIAAYSQCSRNSADRMAERPNFPRAIRLPTSDIGNGRKLWESKTVREFLKHHREPPKKY